MDRYTSLPYEAPNAPIIRIRIFNPILNIEKRPKAIIDSGADMTAVPNKIIEDLQLAESGSVFVGRIGQNSEPEPTYTVDIFFKNFSFTDCEIVDTNSDDNLVCLGRDILNKLNVLLEGKNELFDISVP